MCVAARTSCQKPGVRCPAHAIQFLNYEYTEYIKEVLDLLEIGVNNMEMEKYETWAPYLPIKRQD